MREGLNALLAGAGGRGYVEGTLSTSTLSGPMAALRVGQLLTPRLGLFGEASWSPQESRAGVGVRLAW